MTRSASPYAPFLLACALFVVALAVQFPSLSTRPEMWAEGATDYFFHAHYSDLWTNFLNSDIGYLSWPTRAAAVALDRAGLPLTWIPGAYQAVSLGAIAVFCAFFCLPQFRTLLPSDLARFLICCALCLHKDYDLKAFINFSYYAGIPVFLIMALGPELDRVPRRGALAVGAFLAVFSVSKATLLAYALPALWLFARGWRARNRNLCLMFGPFLLGLAVQAAVLAVMKPLLDVSAPPIPVSSLLYSVLAYLLAIGANLFWGKAFLAAGQGGWRLVPALAGAAASCFALYRLSRARRRSWWVPACALTVCATATALVVAGQSGFFAVPAGAMPYFFRLGERHWFVPAAAPFLAFAILIFRIEGLSEARKTAVLLVWLLGSYPFGLQGLRGDRGWASTGYSNWSAFAPLLPATLQGDACVPVNPYPWLLGVNCGYLTEPPDPGAVFGPAAPAPRAGFAAPAGLERCRVRMVGLVLKGKAPGRPPVLALYDGKDRLLARGRLIQPDARMFSEFYFDAPVAGARRAALEDADGAGPAELVMDAGGKVPVWIWYGRGPG